MDLGFLDEGWDLEIEEGRVSLWGVDLVFLVEPLRRLFLPIVRSVEGLCWWRC